MRLDKPSKHKSTFLVWWAMASLLIASPGWPATQVELTTAVEGELRPTIEGNCNLPDGMKLIVRVRRKESAFESETPVEVQSGHFAVGPLMQGNADLNSGEYHLEIISVHPTDQPDAVRPAIGQKGQALQGPLPDAIRALRGCGFSLRSRLGERQTQNSMRPGASRSGYRRRDGGGKTARHLFGWRTLCGAET